MQSAHRHIGISALTNDLLQHILQLCLTSPIGAKQRTRPRHGTIQPALDNPQTHAHGTQVYILGINFPEKQLVRKALTSLYGISSSSRHAFAQAPALPTAKPSPARLNILSRVMAKHFIHPTATLGSVSSKTLTDLTETLSELTIENDLRRKMRADIARLRDMGSYRGRRHVMNQPVRGQRTRTQVRYWFFGMVWDLCWC